LATNEATAPGLDAIRNRVGCRELEISSLSFARALPRGRIFMEGGDARPVLPTNEKTPAAGTTGDLIFVCRKADWEVEFPGTTTGILRALYRPCNLAPASGF
jgi:hypothetical protein